MTPIGDVVRAARLHKGVGVRELGRICGVDHSYVRHIESGYVAEPSFFKLARIAAILGLELGNLARTTKPGPGNQRRIRMARRKQR